MQRLSVDEVEPGGQTTGVERRGLSAALGATGVAVNHYRIAPGEGFPGGLHAHVDQEELFVVLGGEAVFETMAGAVRVGAGEAVRFAPGEFQSGRNGGDEDLVALALGAPRDGEDVRLPVVCPDCGRADLRLATGGEELSFDCPDCGREHVPRPCPACGGEDLRVTLAEGSEPAATSERRDTAVVCADCGARYDEPPLRE